MGFHNFSLFGHTTGFHAKMRKHIDAGAAHRVKDYILDALGGMTVEEARAHPAREIIQEGLTFLGSQGWRRETHNGVLYLVTTDGKHYSNRT